MSSPQGYPQGDPTRFPDDMLLDMATHPGSYSTPMKALALEQLAGYLQRLRLIETRGQQIRGGLKPYARPVEIVDYLLGDTGPTAKGSGAAGGSARPAASGDAERR